MNAATILSSALRIAAEMERPIEASKSTISRPADSPSQEAEVRTQHTTVDRSAAASRFLRLAFRVNMENLKLIELDPLPELEGLPFDDGATSDDIAGAIDEHVADEHAADAHVVEEEAAPDIAAPLAAESASIDEEPSSAAEPPAMHQTHNVAPAKSCLNADMPSHYSENIPAGNPASAAYAVVIKSPGAMVFEPPAGARDRGR